MPASVVFALRGNSLNARYSSAGKTPASWFSSGTSPITTGTSGFTGEIGGTSINLNGASGANKYLMYNGGANLPSTPGISVLIRCSLDDLASFMGLWNIGCGGISSPGMLQLNTTNTGQFAHTLTDFSMNTGINNVAVASGASTGVLYDIVYTWDGTTGANSAKLYLNNSLIKQYTSTRAWASVVAGMQKLICIGGFSGTNYTKIWVNEFVIWSGVIDPSSVALTSGTGALNGNTRAAFVDAASFDGTVNVGAGAGNILVGASETIAGTTVNGTAIRALAATTKHGVAADDGTGSYRGADLYDVVAANELKHGVTRNQDGSSVLGTYRGDDLWDPVSANDLKFGVSVLQDGSTVDGAYVASCDYPAESDVRDDVDFADGTKTGTLDLAAGADLRSGVTQDNGNIVGTLQQSVDPIEIEIADRDNITIELGEP